MEKIQWTRTSKLSVDASDDSNHLLMITLIKVILLLKYS